MTERRAIRQTERRDARRERTRRLLAEGATHLAPYVEMEFGERITKTEHRPVRVMAIAEGYAMVRRKGCAPYICRVDELKVDAAPGEPT